MDLRKAIYERHSIRAFKSEEVEEEKLMKILKDANQAPSAGNLQGRDFIVLKDKETKKKLAAGSLHQNFIAEAPVVIVICANIPRSAGKYGQRGELYSILDSALAAQNLMLSCVEEGLGTCYIGAFDEGRVKSILGIPDRMLPVAIIPVGYPNETPYITNRLPLKEIVHREKW